MSQDQRQTRIEVVRAYYDGSRATRRTRAFLRGRLSSGGALSGDPRQSWPSGHNGALRMALNPLVEGDTPSHWDHFGARPLPPPPLPLPSPRLPPPSPPPYSHRRRHLQRLRGRLEIQATVRPLVLPSPTPAMSCGELQPGLDILDRCVTTSGIPSLLRVRKRVPARTASTGFPGRADNPSGPFGTPAPVPDSRSASCGRPSGPPIG